MIDLRIYRNPRDLRLGVRSWNRVVFWHRRANFCIVLFEEDTEDGEEPIKRESEWAEQALGNLETR